MMMPVARIFAAPAAVVSLLVALGSALFSAPLAAADAERGGRLYETRCKACHSDSAHSRSARKVKTFDEIRAQVERWTAQVGGNWEPGDIDDVALYLNQRYYRFPCPPRVCKANHAALSR